MFTRNRTKKILAALTQLKELNTQRAGLVTELGAHVERLAGQVEGIVDSLEGVFDRHDIEDIVNEKIAQRIGAAVSDELDGMSSADFGFDMDTLVANAIHSTIEDGSLLALIASKLAVTVADETETEEVPA
jgi:hypothetical protein